MEAHNFCQRVRKDTNTRARAIQGNIKEDSTADENRKKIEMCCREINEMNHQDDRGSTAIILQEKALDTKNALTEATL